MNANRVICPMCSVDFHVDEIQHHAARCGEDPPAEPAKPSVQDFDKLSPSPSPSPFPVSPSPLPFAPVQNPFQNTITNSNTNKSNSNYSNSYSSNSNSNSNQYSNNPKNKLSYSGLHKHIGISDLDEGECNNVKCLKAFAELREYREVIDQVIIYINQRDKVQISTLEEIQEHIKNFFTNMTCVVCKLAIQDEGVFQKHVEGCMDLSENDEIKAKISELRSLTNRPDQEIYLLARFHDLLDEKGFDDAKALLSAPTPIDVNNYLYRKPPPKVLRADCPICYDTFPISSLYTLDCPKSHRFCIPCIHNHIKHGLSEGHVSSCPDPSCKYEISQQEIAQLFGKDGTETESYTDVLLKRELAKLPVVGCPTAGCKNFIEMDSVTIPVRCICSGCAAQFCSMCKKEYHFRMSCSDAMVYTKRWIDWNNKGRQEYHNLLAQEQQKVIEGFEAEVKRIEQRNAELQRRYEELVIDEKWKEQKCHACPHCGRPIEKLDGCDSMVCGSDYHGGNIQNGCGKRFQWSQSQPYKSSGLEGPKKEAAPPPPNPKQRTNHGEWQCDACKKDIVGVRFCCINCTSFNLCELCEFKVDHTKGHVFRLFEKKEEEEVAAAPAKSLPARPKGPLPKPPNTLNNFLSFLKT